MKIIKQITKPNHPIFKEPRGKERGHQAYLLFLFNPGLCCLLLWLIKSWGVIEKTELFLEDEEAGDMESSSYLAFHLLYDLGQVT